MRKFIPGKGFYITAKLEHLKVLDLESDNTSKGFRIFASSAIPENPFILDSNGFVDKVLGVDDSPVDYDKYKDFQNFNIPFNPDYLYVDAWLASALDPWGPNENGDAFEAEELEERHYTWLFRGIYIDHDNNDISKAKGIILGTHYDTESKRIRIIFALSRKLYPDVCERIEKGQWTDVSLGLIARSAECSICGNIATGEGTSCEHIVYKGIKPGYYEINRGITGIENSIITDAGADINAKMIKTFAGLKESPMKITAAWLGQTFFPVFNKLKDAKVDISSREKVLSSLKSLDEKEVERFIAAMSDDDYTKILSQFILGTEVNMEQMPGATPRSTMVTAMKIDDLIKGLQLLGNAGFTFTGKPAQASEELKPAEPVQASGSNPEDIAKKGDAQDMDTIAESTNNDEIENAAETASDTEEGTEVTEDAAGVVAPPKVPNEFATATSDTATAAEEIENPTPNDAESVKEKSEQLDARTNDDDDMIGGVDKDEASAAGKKIKEAKKEVASEARSLRETSVTPTSDIISEISQNKQQFLHGEGLTSFQKTAAFNLEKGDVLVTRTGKKYLFESSQDGSSAKVVDASSNKTIEIYSHRNVRLVGRKGVTLGSKVSVRLPQSIREGSVLASVHGSSGVVVKVFPLYASVDLGQSIVNIPYDCLTGKPFTTQPGQLSRFAILINRPDWATDPAKWKQVVTAAKTRKDLTTAIAEMYHGMTKAADPIQEPKSVVVNESRKAFASIFPVGSRVRFVLNGKLLHSKVKDLTEAGEVVLNSGRKVRAQELMQEGVFLTFASFFRKNNNTRVLLSNKVKELEVLSGTIQKLKDDNAILANKLRKATEEKAQYERSVAARDRVRSSVLPIVRLAESKNYGPFADTGLTSFQARKAMLNQLATLPEDKLRSIKAQIENFTSGAKLVRYSGKAPVDIPSAVAGSKFEEFDDLIRQM